MIARATGTASSVVRFLDGVCDHLVFVLLYVALAWSIGSPGGWLLGSAAAAAHAVQATLYEGERARFHRRVRGDPGAFAPPSRNPAVRAYDGLAGSMDRLAAPFDRLLQRSADPQPLGEAYGWRAVPAIRLMALLGNNMRVLAIYLACLAGSPFWFWWLELVPLFAIAVAGMVWHRRIEAAFVGAGDARA